MWGGLLSLVFDKSEEKAVKTFEIDEVDNHKGFKAKFIKFKNYAFVDFVDDIAVQFACRTLSCRINFIFNS